MNNLNEVVDAAAVFGKVFGDPEKFFHNLVRALWIEIILVAGFKILLFATHHASQEKANSSQNGDDNNQKKQDSKPAAFPPAT